MASYLLVIPELAGSSEYQIVTADSARQAVAIWSAHHDITEVRVWTLRSADPRVFTVRTETRRIVELSDE